jgi:hypothetical protein
LDLIGVESFKPLQDEIDARAPRPSLRNGTKAKVWERNGRIRKYVLGFKRGKPMRIAHLIEFGTQPHSLKRGASVRKGIFVGQPPMHPGDPPEPFMRPAFEATKDRVKAEFGSRIWALILRTVTRER